MNLVFLIGKVGYEPKFDFIINNKYHDSICQFNLILLDDTLVHVKGYDAIADFCYQNLNFNSFVFICGELNNQGNINIIEIQILN